ncbi:hypothetical protein [Histophilus somni]|uniref:hypothetical protein n=1 Tax=Histophilus somni TaxID=731 RepID=UPI000039723B|nr:hypothetical protein [Histophilus somni]ACA31970.1 conserved hypothetical protein [Histophilus somni 2336]
MKYKLSLAILSILPALSHAGGGNFNFYGKAGIDLTSRFETMVLRTEQNNYVPSIPASSRQNTFSPSIFFETTYTILPQTEIGLGLGYIKRKGFDHSASWHFNKDIQKKTWAQTSGFTDIEQYRIYRYSSLPIYLILKQNYAFNANSKFYLKGNIGYSINKMPNTKYAHYSNETSLKIQQTQIGDPIYKMKAKNGLYLGLGIGIEYKSFLAEIGYYHTHATVSYKNKNTQYPQYSYNNDAIRLTLGVKF